VNWWWLTSVRLRWPTHPPTRRSSPATNGDEPIELRRNREFTVLDPDGYKLLFFKRK